MDCGTCGRMCCAVRQEDKKYPGVAAKAIPGLSLYLVFKNLTDHLLAFFEDVP